MAFYVLPYVLFLNLHDLFTHLLSTFLEFEACPPGEFQCNNGRCMDIRRKCNGYDECGDGSDEANCSRFQDQLHFKDIHCIRNVVTYLVLDHRGMILEFHTYITIISNSCIHYTCLYVYKDENVCKQ